MNQQKRTEQMAPQSVVFTTQMMTVFIEHEKMIDKVLKRCHDLTATEFCILRALYLAGGEANGLDFAQFLMLKRNSISIALSSLARKDLASKAPSERDRRMLHVTETAAGRKITRDATASIYEAQKATFWSNLSLEDERGGNLVASLVLSKLRGVDYSATAPLKDENTPISSEFVVFCKMVPQRWDFTLKKHSELSLTDFRILTCLDEWGSAARASDIARYLLLERSVVSTRKDALITRGLVAESVDENDRRNSNLVVTEHGAVLAERLKAHLSTETADMYSLCEEANLSNEINDWHRVMYANMSVMNYIL